MTENPNRKLRLIEGADGYIYRGVSKAWPEAIYDPETRQWRQIEVRFRPEGWGYNYDGPDPADEV